jgi:hypothetical protein
MIEKTRVVKINKTPEEVKAIFEQAIREEDESVVFPDGYGFDLHFEQALCVIDEENIVHTSMWPTVSIQIEIPEPRKPGRPNGDMGGIIIGPGTFNLKESVTLSNGERPTTASTYVDPDDPNVTPTGES